MSKERLEEIENKLLQATNEDDEDVVYASICAEAVLEDLQWTVGYAKKQAERVAELETDSSAFHTLEILYMESEQQNEKFGELINNLFDKLYEYENQIIRYREALEFYADNDNYNTKYDSISDAWGVIEIAEDNGKIARRTLNESE